MQYSWNISTINQFVFYCRRSWEVLNPFKAAGTSEITIAPLQDEVLHVCHYRNWWIEEAICVERKCIVIHTTKLMTQSCFHRTAYETYINFCLELYQSGHTLNEAIPSFTACFRFDFVRCWFKSSILCEPVKDFHVHVINSMVIVGQK